LLHLLTANAYLPVVACVAGDRQGQIYNVNADQLAVACAVAYGARALVFLTDVEGVRDAQGAVRQTLTASQCEALISEGVATGGMQAKLTAAMDALRGGVENVRIAPGAAANALSRLLAGEALGTRIAPMEAPEA
jgi:acetylglutamate kinase